MSNAMLISVGATLSEGWAGPGLDCPESGPGPRGPGSGPDRPYRSECPGQREGGPAPIL